MLSTPPDNVVVRTFSGPGHYGRSNGGNAGAEDEAVILSKEVGKPVRVQWMRPEDFQWSTQSPAALSDVEIGLDANGKMVAYQIDHYMPAMQDDRPIGAVLAGLPTMPAPSEKGVFVGSTVNDPSGPVDLRRRRDINGTRSRHLPGRAEVFAAHRRAARSQHANAGTVPAEFPARAGGQRGGGAGWRGCHSVPDRPCQGRARHRRAQGCPRSLGMGNAIVAACEGGGVRLPLPCVVRACR